VREDHRRAGHSRDQGTVLVDRERRSDDATDLTDEDLATRPGLLGGLAVLLADLVDAADGWSAAGG
jgi:hypothetical protein